MSHTTVVNLRDVLIPGYIRIDRRTKWGNPFVIGRDGDREAVIHKYTRWLAGEMVLGRISPEDVAALSGKRLACWCAPDRCHGEILAKWADTLAAAGYPAGT